MIKKIFKTIAFLSLSMCLMLNNNVSYAGTCYEEIRTGVTALKNYNEMKIYVPNRELVLLDRWEPDRIRLKRKILKFISDSSYNKNRLKEISPFEISESVAKDWYSISKNNHNCGVIVIFHCRKDGSFCVYHDVKPQQ